MQMIWIVISRMLIVLFAIYMQLQCTIKDEWMWDFICKTWLNQTNCYRNENNVIHLKSFVKHQHVDKMKENNTDCLFFTEAFSHYTNKRNWCPDSIEIVKFVRTQTQANQMIYISVCI